MVKNEERFTGKADVYKKFRTSYPKELIDYLYSKIGFSRDSTIADIGSGTGIFSRLLLERGSNVYCVEPNDDMRQVAENELRNFAGYKNFISIKATAENTGLPEKSIDFITAAISFHWFNRTAFSIECHRILKDDGKVVLIYDIGDKTEFIKKYLDIWEKYRLDSKQPYITGEPPEDIRNFFQNSVCDEMSFINDIVWTRDSFIGRVLSRSYSPTKNNNPNEYYGLINELGILFDDYSIDGIINDPHFTKSYIGKVSGG